MRTRSLLFIILYATIILCGCLTQEYDYRENHPIYFEHEKHHDHDHDHDAVVEDKGFETLVDEMESKERIIWQKPDKVIEMLGDLKGKTVADIGAGTGYFSFRLAQEAERVVAIDIDGRFLQYMDSVKRDFPETIHERIATRLATFDSPNLMPEEADAVILVNTYTYIEDRIGYFKKVRQGMKPGGQLLIVDYKKKRLPEGQGPPVDFRMSADSVETELELAGYRLMETDDTTLDYQYIILVTKP